MVAILVEMIHQVSVDVSLSRGYRDGQQASLLAESGVTGGTKLLQLALQVQGKDYTSLSDVWAVPIKLDDETGTIEITVAEESGKICLNGLIGPNGVFEPLTQAALKRLGKRLQIPEDCWNALADWLDTNGKTRSGGAGTSYYKTMKPPYSAHNGNLASLSELSLVKGFTPEIVAKLQPFVTIYSDQAGTSMSTLKVNINTAPMEVIAALADGIDDGMAGRILDKRRLNPFKTVGELSQFDAQIGALLASEATFIGTVFRITSVSRVKETARTVEAVVRLVKGLQPVNLSWQEY
jgi:general secretion pathway protein K